MKTYQITLTAQELEIIQEALGFIQARFANPVYKNIGDQLAEQSKEVSAE